MLKHFAKLWLRFSVELKFEVLATAVGCRRVRIMDEGCDYSYIRLQYLVIGGGRGLNHLHIGVANRYRGIWVVGGLQLEIGLG